MKSTIKIGQTTSAAVEPVGLMVAVHLRKGFLAFTENVDPHQALALGEALVRAAHEADAAREAAGVVG